MNPGSNSSNFSSLTQSRKADHIRICLEDDVQSDQITTGFERYRFRHCCLPELDYAEIDLGVTFLEKKLGAPLLISSMTGGTEYAQLINYRLAEIAQQYHLAMGVGSQRILIENPQLAKTFMVRSVAPNILLFANLGAVQLNYQYTLEDCQKLVDILEADGLILHLNPLQECIQSEGDRNFKGLLLKIEKLCQSLPVPILVKEVGNGISAPLAQALINRGIKAIDVAGAGGTSWAKIEGQRANNSQQKELGNTFANWGIPTAECVVKVREIAPTIPLIASGGLKDGIDVSKAIALGADLAGLARPFLIAAAQSTSSLQERVELLLAEMKTVLFCTGNPTFSTLKKSQVLEEI